MAVDPDYYGNRPVYADGPIQDALNTAAATGRPVIIPPGTYDVDSLSIPENTRLSGYGDKTVLRRIPNSTSSKVLAIAGPNVHIANLTLDGNGGGIGANNSGCIQSTLIGNHDISIHRCTIRNTYNHGIRIIDSAGGISIVDCKIDGYGMGGGGSGIVMNSQRAEAPVSIQDIKIIGNQIVRHPNNSAGYGMMVRGSDNNTTRVTSWVRIANNYVNLATDGQGSGLAIESWCDHAVIEGNVVRSVDGTLGYGISNGRSYVTITGNIVSGFRHAIEASATTESTYVACTGNLIDTCDNGIESWGGYSRSTITGNVITNFGVSSGESAGILARGARAVVSGNVMDSAADGAMGIDVVAELTVCEGNQIELVGTGGKGIQSTAPRVTIQGNLIQANVGIELGGASPKVLTGAITGNDLSGCATAVLKTGTSTIGDFPRLGNAGDG